MSEICELNFKTFCAPKNTKYLMKEPFVKNGWLCATDGRILIRTRSGLPDTEGTTPDIESIFATTMTPCIPHVPIVEPKWVEDRCGDCGGRGKQQVLCDSCEGEGIRNCPECDSEVECKDCNGDGNVPSVVPCLECNGSGKTPQAEKVKMCELWFGGKYIYKIYKNLPNSRVVAVSINSMMMKFNFDGGEGILMGLTV